MTLPSQNRDNFCSIFHINEMIGVMISMIASIMTTEVSVPIIDSIDREIKIFLSNIHKVHTSLPSTLSNATSSKNFKIIWLSIYNFQSLFNIPDEMRRFGPLVNLWEGSNQGEGYLRYAKPKVINIPSKNWKFNAHVKLLNDNAFQSVVDCHLQIMTTSSENNERYRGRKMVHA